MPRRLALSRSRSHGRDRETRSRCCGGIGCRTSRAAGFQRAAAARVRSHPSRHGSAPGPVGPGRGAGRGLRLRRLRSWPRSAGLSQRSSKTLAEGARAKPLLALGIQISSNSSSSSRDPRACTGMATRAQKDRQILYFVLKRSVRAHARPRVYACGLQARGGAC